MKTLCIVSLVLDHVFASVGLVPDPEISLDRLRQELTFRVERFILGRSVVSVCSEELMGAGSTEIRTDDLQDEYGSENVDSMLRDVIISSCKLPDPPIIPDEDLNRVIEKNLMPNTQVLPLGVFRVHLTLPSLHEGIYRGSLMPSGAGVLIKCKLFDRSSIRDEFFHTYSFKSEPWCPDILIPLSPTIDGHSKCFGTQYLSGVIPGVLTAL